MHRKMAKELAQATAKVNCTWTKEPTILERYKNKMNKSRYQSNNTSPITSNFTSPNMTKKNTKRDITTTNTKRGSTTSAFLSDYLTEDPIIMMNRRMP